MICLHSYNTNELIARRDEGIARLDEPITRARVTRISDAASVSDLSRAVRDAGGRDGSRRR